jgi:FkbM family methyltransferase
MLIKLKSLLPIKLKSQLKKLRKFNAYHDLDKKLLKYMDYQNGFYIDCGANDGVNQSTTWYFEKYLNWKGILIEPITDVYDELKKNRSHKNYFYNYALVSSDYKKDHINFIFNKNDSLQAKSKPKEDFNLKKNENIISVRCTTLKKILNKSKVPKLIDLFSLDTEGSELDVLKGINFNLIKFKYILIETEFPMKINEYLNKRGYYFVKRLSNYKFKKKPKFGDYLYSSINK